MKFHYYNSAWKISGLVDVRKLWFGSGPWCLCKVCCTNKNQRVWQPEGVWQERQFPCFKDDLILLYILFLPAICIKQERLHNITQQDFRMHLRQLKPKQDMRKCHDMSYNQIRIWFHLLAPRRIIFHTNCPSSH